MGKIALFGATGSLGRSLGKILGAAGIAYRVVGRNQFGLQVRFQSEPGATIQPEVQVWDPEEDASVETAASGVDTLIYLVGIPLWKYHEHPALVRRVLAAAKKAGVRRFLLVSPVYSIGLPQTEFVSEEHPREPQTSKGQKRKEQEDLVLAAHVPGVFETAILRLPDFYGPHVEQSLLWSAFQAAKKSTHAQLLGPIDRPHEFVYVPDVAATIVQLLETPAAWGGAQAQFWNLGAAGVTTVKAMTEAIFAAAGLTPNYAVPGKLKLWLIGTMNPYVREMRELDYLLETPVLLDDSRLRELLGELQKTPYAEGIRLTLAATTAVRDSRGR